jgi:hypothetical protein
MTYRVGVGGGIVAEPSEEFRKRAADCFRWAQNALTERARVAWLSMAQFWLQLAQRVEGGEDERSSASDRSGQDSLLD